MRDDDHVEHDDIDDHDVNHDDGAGDDNVDHNHGTGDDDLILVHDNGAWWVHDHDGTRRLHHDDAAG